jgi:hypothetical protein
MSINIQNYQLMQQLKTPLAKKLAPVALDLADFFRRDMQHLELETGRKWGPEGSRDEAQKLRRKVIRDLRDNIRKPIDERRAKTEEMRAKATMPAFDKTDKDAAKARREMRDRSYVMTSGERRGLMSGPNRDTDFIDAVRERKPWVSGIREPDELQIWEIAKQERLRDLNGPLLDAVADCDSEDEEALMVYNKVRNDIVADSGLERDEFEAEAKPIESKAGALWLVNDRTQVCEVGADGKATYRPASVDEARDGKEYSDITSYLADRAA